MSTLTLQPIQKSRVLIRAYGMQPLDRFALAKNEEIFEICCKNNYKTVCFHKHDVFMYDESLFAELTTAYEERDVEGIARAWERAQLFQPTPD